MSPRLSKDLNCRGCGSLDHKKDVCPHFHRGIAKPAAVKKEAAIVRCKPLTPEESSRLEQLAMDLLKQKLVGMTVQPSDHRLLERIREVMVTWSAVHVPVIVRLALDDLDLEGGEGGREEAVSEVVCESGATETICISSDTDSFDHQP